MSTRPISLALVLAAVIPCASSSAQLRVRGRFAVTQAAAEKAIAEDLFHEETIVPGVEVRLLSSVVAFVPAAQLDVTGIKQVRQEASGSGRGVQLLVRFSCHVRSVCVPFYGRVSVPLDVSLPAVLNVPRHPASPSDTDTTHTTTARPARPTLQRGTHATLLLDDGRSQIELPVIALADAAVGESVRVASLDRRHIYTARTVSATQLKGEF